MNNDNKGKFNREMQRGKPLVPSVNFSLIKSLQGTYLWGQSNPYDMCVWLRVHTADTRTAVHISARTQAKYTRAPRLFENNRPHLSLSLSI